MRQCRPVPSLSGCFPPRVSGGNRERDHASLAANGVRPEATIPRVDVEHITTRPAGADSGRGRHNALVLPRTGKGRKSRSLANPPRANAALMAAADGRTHKPLLRTSTGRRISTDQIRDSVKVLAKRAGVGLTTHVDREDGRTVIEVWLHPHSLRHTFAALDQLRLRRPPRGCQDALGHADPAPPAPRPQRSTFICSSRRARRPTSCAGRSSRRSRRSPTPATPANSTSTTTRSRRLPPRRRRGSLSWTTPNGRA